MKGKGVARLLGQPFKKRSLCPAVAFAEGVKLVDGSHQVRRLLGEGFAGEAAQLIGAGEPIQ